MVEEKEQLNLKFAAILISVSVLIALILGLTLGRYLWNDLQKTSKELKSKREILKADKDRLSNLVKLKDKEEELKIKNKTVLEALPKDSDVAGLFVQFERIASESGVNLKSSNETTGTSKKNSSNTSLITEEHYALDGQSANYDALKQMIIKAEDALRIISITDMDITLSTGSMNVKITTKTYSRK